MIRCCEKMAGNEVALSVVTLFWFAVGCSSFFAPKGPNRGLIQVMLILTAVCCYTFWLLTFLHQMNPLFGPVYQNTTARYMKTAWRTS
ncbi:V-type proton ATPase subunit e [Trichinella murrelli]|uniref:V-type proton ATPase subunit e n=1 Tax=Trichinella murrelli TaxID=144512 RepID=A0A0V0UGT7_9BILA|nr:V-type proton ATPase subunit e [Trichinella murrelli]